MKLKTICEVMCAAHLSRLVVSDFESRGAIALLGPPGSFKTTILKTLESYPDAMGHSDINNTTLGNVRDQLGSSINSLVFYDLQKLYERHSSTSSNIEGCIRGLIDEGWHSPSYQDSRIQRSLARCFVAAAVTTDLLIKHFTEWQASGFLRRILWVAYELDDPHLLLDSVEHRMKIAFNTAIIPIPADRRIVDMTTKAERSHFRHWVKSHYAGPAATVPYQLICKIAAVLKWHYSRIGTPDQYMYIMEDFAPSLGKEGCKLELSELWANSQQEGIHQNGISKGIRGVATPSGGGPSKNRKRKGVGRVLRKRFSREPAKSVNRANPAAKNRREGD